MAGGDARPTLFLGVGVVWWCGVWFGSAAGAAEMRVPMGGAKHWDQSGRWIELHSGEAFCFQDQPTIWAKYIELADIAHALSNICRFNGHCREFYSVAQHSAVCALLAAEAMPKGLDPACGLRVPRGELELARWMLLHDAHEAYIGDISAPLKKWIALGGQGDSTASQLKGIAREIDSAVESRFGVLRSTHPDWEKAVKGVDLAVMKVERRCLMSDRWEWPQLADVPEAVLDGVEITAMGPREARRGFMAVFDALFGASRGVLSSGDWVGLWEACGLSRVSESKEGGPGGPPHLDDRPGGGAGGVA